MNALADKGHKQGMPHGDMRSITWPHYSTTIPYISSSKFSANLRAFATLLGERERAHHYVTVLMKFLYVCMYVCMYGGHSVLRSNSKLHDNFGKIKTHARPRMPRIILV